MSTIIYKNMFYLYLKNESLPAFEDISLKSVCEDYCNHCINNDCNPAIERIEKCDNEGNIIEIILGDLIQGELEHKIKNYKRQCEIESSGLTQVQKEALTIDGGL